MKQIFKVNNVKCGGCANTLKSTLEKTFGRIEVDLTKNPREITLDIEKNAIPELRIQLKRLGYPMSDEDLSTIEGFSTTAKSFVSCAMGKIHN
jgi:copper chaperone CopZ